jgi:predicted kinase
MDLSVLSAEEVQRLDRKGLKPLCKRYGIKLVGTVQCIIDRHRLIKECIL